MDSPRFTRWGGRSFATPPDEVDEGPDLTVPFEDRGSKLIFQLIRKGAAAPGESASGRWQFFDLAQDPGEQRNLVETRPPDLRRLRTALEAWMRQSADSTASEEQSDETVRALKALGYLQ